MFVHEERERRIKHFSTTKIPEIHNNDTETWLIALE